MIPPVTMLAVPIVSSTNPQKIPACMQAGPQVLEHLGLDERVLDQADDARREPVANGCEGRATAKTRRWRAIASEEERRRAPEHEEDERVGRDLGERSRTSARSASLVGGGERDRVIVRAREGVEGVIQHRLDRLERFEGALRAAGQVHDQASGRGRRRRRATGRRAGVVARPAARIASARPGTS